MPTPEILFFKVNIKIFKEDGFLAAISPQRLHTLIGLATFMDEKGYCYPPEDLLAKILGISITQVSVRVTDLAKFKWKGDEVIAVIKVRNKKGRFDNNSYYISFESGVSIFDSD